jgi:predicted porin
MNKFALSSIALLFVASAANAQSNVAVFGVIDTFTQYTNTGNGYTAAVDSSGLFGTRWGVKGSEDLGGGLKVDYILEQGFKSDTGAASDPTRMFSRQSWVGIGNELGQVRIGRQNALMFINEGKLDAFFGASMASGLNNFSTYSVRTDKTVSYFSPKMGPMQFQVYYGLGSTGGGHRAPNGSYSGAVNYDARRLHLAVVHQAVRNALGTDTQRVSYAGGSYDFDALTTYVAYHKAKSALVGIDKDVLSLSVKYHLTPVTDISLGYSYLQDDTVKHNNAQQIGAMVHYYLSKRTQLYTTLSYLKNTHSGNYTLGGAAVAGLPLAYAGASPKGIQMGIVHFF